MTGVGLDIYVFLGPTLPAAEAAQLLDATYLPPASQGDIVALLPRRPRAIAIVDGFFEHVPSVWHKEILLALSRGVRMFGAASMGALRGVELEPFGMVAVGRIADAYRSGLLEGDDEVAVQHGPAEYGYPVVSEALVNVRATLDAAFDEGLVTRAESATIVAAIKGLYYGDRSWPRVLAAAADAGLDASGLERLRRYVAEQRTDQKRADARELLRHLAGLDLAIPPAQPSWQLARTRYLDRLLERDRSESSTDEPRLTAQDLVDHARLVCPELPEARRRAREHATAVQLAHRLGLLPRPADVAEASEGLWQELGCASAEQRQSWLERNRMSPGELAEHARERALVALVHRRGLEEDLRPLLWQLRLLGAYPQLCTSALAQARSLAEAAPEPAAIPSFEALLAAFGEARGTPAADPSVLARELGFEDRRALRRELERWWTARRRAPAAPASAEPRQGAASTRSARRP